MRQHQHRSIDLVQRGAFVHRNVVGLVTLDLVLRVVRAGVMGVTLVVSVLLVHLDDLATYVARLRAARPPPAPRRRPARRPSHPPRRRRGDATPALPPPRPRVGHAPTAGAP